MAETFLTFVVDDTSPSISYSPFPDTFGTPDLSAGWNPYFTSSGFATAQGVVGEGTSQHITSLDGASLSFQWRGSGIKLLGNATQASYNISIDGALVSLVSASPKESILLDATGLPEMLHNITLTATITPSQSLAPNTSSMLVFDQAVILSFPIMPTPKNYSFTDSTLNDADISFSGLWSIDPAPSTGDTPRFHTSKTIGDRAFTTFNGSTLLVLGRTSPEAGNYTVNLDGGNSTGGMNLTFSAKSSFAKNDSLLFFASDLDTTVPHSVQVTNTDGSELALAIGGFRAFVPFVIPPANTTQVKPVGEVSTKRAFEKGTIAAFALAGILAFILISAALFFFLVYRPRRRRQRQAAGSIQRTHASVGANGELRYGEKGYQADTPALINIAPMYDVKEEPDLEASPLDDDHLAEGGPSNRFSTISQGLQRWTRAAVRGSMGSAALGGLRFRHSDSPPGHISQDSTPGDSSPHEPSARERPLSEGSSWTETSSAARRRLEKRAGKMRAIASRSWLPSPTYTSGAGTNEGNGHRYSRRESRRQSRRASIIPSPVSPAPVRELAGAAAAGAAAGGLATHFASDAAASRRRTLPEPHSSFPTRRPLEGTTEAPEPPSYAASVANSHSHSDLSSPVPNPRSVDPSLIIPLSVSTAPADAENERDAAGETNTVSDVTHVGHSPRASIIRPRENLAAVLAGPRASAPPRINTAVDRKDMRDLLRSLSPRTSSTPSRRLPAPPNPQDAELTSRWMPSMARPLDMEALPEEQSPDSATSPTQRPLLSATGGVQPNRFVKRLPQTPSSPVNSRPSMMASPSGSDDDPEGPFLRLREPSPFRVEFNSSSRRTSVRPLPSPKVTSEKIGGSASMGGSSNPDIFFTPSISSSVGQSSSTRAVDDDHEGPSRQPFRLTALTFPTSSKLPSISSPQPPSATNESAPRADAVASFLDFTNSRETSYQHPQPNRATLRSLPKPPIPPIPTEPQSRWSNTTVPSVMTTALGGTRYGNESSGESQLGAPVGDREARHFSATSGTFPIPVQITVPPSPHHIMEHTPSPPGSGSEESRGRPQLSSIRTSGVTQSGAIHAHPAMGGFESPTDTIPVSDSEIQFRHSYSDSDAEPSLRTTGQHLFVPLNPSTSSSSERRSRPYDPHVLVSRVLGLPSAASSTTVRPSPSHVRTTSASTPSASNTNRRSNFNPRSDMNSSSDGFTNSRPGPSS